MNSPSSAQMRALQWLREGTLVWGAASAGLYNIGIDHPKGGQSLAPITAQKLIDNRWVVLKKFSARKGEYQLTESGLSLTNLLCNCSPAKTELSDYTLLSGIDPSTTKKHDWKKERLLCQSCWRVARCAYVTRPMPGVIGVGPSHAANRFIWGVGPICVEHTG
jgi:hypothetical protein